VAATEGSPLLALDVRPSLERGDDPLDEILQTLDRLTPDGLLVLTAPFRPGPLITLLTDRGYRLHASKLGPRHWQVEILTPLASEIADYRDLPAPEPLEEVLKNATHLSPGSSFLARVPRVPRLLFPLLKERHLDWAILEEESGSAFLHIHRGGDTA
jgi:uncharacterized protein (DUF2249 family)